MGKKANKKPKKVIDLYNGIKGTYLVYVLGSERYSPNGAPKNAGTIIPFIDSKAITGATPRAKKCLLDFPANKTSRLIKKLIEVKLPKTNLNK